MIEVDNVKSNLALIMQKAINIRNTSTGQNKTRAAAIITLLDKINIDIPIIENHITKNTLTPDQISNELQPLLDKLRTRR